MVTAILVAIDYPAGSWISGRTPSPDPQTDVMKTVACELLWAQSWCCKDNPGRVRGCRRVFGTSGIAFPEERDTRHQPDPPRIGMVGVLETARSSSVLSISSAGGNGQD